MIDSNHGVATYSLVPEDAADFLQARYIATSQLRQLQECLEELIDLSSQEGKNELFEASSSSSNAPSMVGGWLDQVFVTACQIAPLIFFPPPPHENFPVDVQTYGISKLALDRMVSIFNRSDVDTTSSIYRSLKTSSMLPVQVSLQHISVLYSVSTTVYVKYIIGH